MPPLGVDETLPEHGKGGAGLPFGELPQSRCQVVVAGDGGATDEYRAAPEAAKRVWIDTDHFFRGVDRVKVLDQVIDFMEDGLGVTR